MGNEYKAISMLIPNFTTFPYTQMAEELSIVARILSAKSIKENAVPNRKQVHFPSDYNALVKD